MTPTNDSSEAQRVLAQAGVCVVPGVIDADTIRDVRRRLLAAADAFRGSGASTFMPLLDPNDRNVRVFNLIELDETFRELILHAGALRYVRALLGEHFMISNFTANIALPGSRSMALHSDQALVAPEPWLAPWSMNVIWCLDDVHAANGGTRYIPGSHRYKTCDELPADPMAHTVSFVAAAGSIVIMDGRTWHTSGANTTATQERALLFGYYSLDFVRPQVNWNVVLSSATQRGVSAELHRRLGLGPTANVRIGGETLARRHELARTTDA
ncbi:MAG: phytanoyl-CoA dioxygenase family protein [Gammaproteobacteria bacterium]|nr:phytanoyl-CoA dioxygenase family protein [Gammaproteobacteria bacterium]